MNWRDARSWAASWELGDVPAWAAFVLAAIALVFSIRAQKDGRKSANAAVESVAAAKASVEEARLSRIASEKSATVAAETLADQRRDAAERRAAEEEASRPRVELRIEYRSGSVFHLINQGRARAEHIRTVGDYPSMTTWPDNLSLGENESHRFMMMGDMVNRVPAMVRFVWDGQDEPVSLPVPRNSA
ncbi:hypothetical protein [Streptomyces sp. NPDC057429]|uniref:hypothetical protein n=1 Tax=Streptomyces sp. NPDC057429 TaxID=3346130 RepID=UPI0036912BC6